MKFRSDAQRRAYVEKKGLSIQNDEDGCPGVAVPKAGADGEEKEIRVGKRLSANKVKTFAYGEEFDRDELRAQNAKNKSNLKVERNSKEPSGSGMVQILLYLG